MKLLRQRKDGDCGVVALRHLLHIPYEDIYAVALQVQPAFSKKGLKLRELREIASRLGRPLRIERRPDLDQDTGVLGVNWNWTKSYGHWVLLDKGRILEGSPEPELWDADEYLSAKNGRPGWLLTEET